MVSVIAALTLGGNWKIHDSNSYKTSFPNFLKILKNLGFFVTFFLKNFIWGKLCYFGGR